MNFCTRKYIDYCETEVLNKYNKIQISFRAKSMFPPSPRFRAIVEERTEIFYKLLVGEGHCKILKCQGHLLIGSLIKSNCGSLKGLCIVNLALREKAYRGYT